MFLDRLARQQVQLRAMPLQALSMSFHQYLLRIQE
jgi:hypothetical protein